MTAISRRSVTLALAIGLAMCAPWLFTGSHAQQASRPAAPAIDADDIGGVVTGPNGPEAGVWVIAETHDLPVRYIKIVVTDDQGRYVIPDLPRARYDVWVRGYGLVDSAKSASEPGKIVNVSATPAPTPADAARVLPGDLLVLDAEDPDGVRDGEPRAVRRQHDAAAMARRGEEPRLRRLPSARPALDADHSGVARHVRVGRRRVAPPRAVGPGRRHDVRPVERAGPGLVQVLRRLDRSHREGRAAAQPPEPSAGRRAQHRRHAARLDEREAVPARSHLERSPLSRRSTATGRSSDRPSTART